MTRKHFEAIAALIKEKFDFIDSLSTDRDGHDEAFDLGYDAGVADVAKALARYFKEENPNFNEDKFLDACGLK